MYRCSVGFSGTPGQSVGGNQDPAAAQGRIKVRVKITQPDGSIVYAEPDNGADLTVRCSSPGQASRTATGIRSWPRSSRA